VGVQTGRHSKKPAKRSARELALDVLTRVEQDGSYSNLLLGQSLAGESLERADAALATELVYGTIQRLNTIDYFLERWVRKGIQSLQPWVRCLLRLSFYQLHYLQRIPDHAAVNEAVTIARKRGHSGIAGLVNAVLRSAIRQRADLVISDSLPAAKRISLAHSHPEWLVERWIGQFGETTAEAIMAANNRPPHSSARVNTLRHSREALLAGLAAAGIAAAPSALAPAGIVLSEGGNWAQTEAYARGDLSIQDESSMLVAEIADPHPGMRVLDCCAAPGGKTGHLAEKMQDRGELWACDLHAHKMKLIEQQARRLKLSCIHTIAGDARELPEQFAAESFDCVLLDAPCTGLGVIRRKPDIKWAKLPEDIAAIARVQRELLDRMAGLVKPGGMLLYSTCTIAVEENQQAIAAFLAEHSDFAPDLAEPERIPELKSHTPAASLSLPLRQALREEGMVQILPHEYDSDGFFIAKLRKRLKI
jgi:16S rRNA (cytosine967-C5)-methyltransferase